MNTKVPCRDARPGHEVSRDAQRGRFCNARRGCPQLGTSRGPSAAWGAHAREWHELPSTGLGPHYWGGVARPGTDWAAAKALAAAAASPTARQGPVWCAGGGGATVASSTFASSPSMLPTSSAKLQLEGGGGHPGGEVTSRRAGAEAAVHRQKSSGRADGERANLTGPWQVSRMWVARGPRGAKARRTLGAGSGRC